MGSMGKPFRVLLVEDDDDIREVLTAIFRDCGYEVYSLVCAEAAALALQEGIRPDVAVVDVKLPGVDGSYFVTRVQGRFPCILMSASKCDVAPLGVPFLLKPFDLEDMVNLVAETIMVHQATSTATGLRRVRESQPIRLG